MFQNPMIAKDYGKQVTKDLKSVGIAPKTSESRGRRAAIGKERQLDRWVQENVGLD